MERLHFMVRTNESKANKDFSHSEIEVSTTSTTEKYGVWNIWDTTESEDLDHSQLDTF